MKLIIPTAILALTLGVAADNCNTGIQYCGQTLLDRGNYQSQIDQALVAAGQQIVDSGRSALFFCDGGDGGDIHWIQTCSVSCLDKGQGVSDACE